MDEFVIVDPNHLCCVALLTHYVLCSVTILASCMETCVKGKKSKGKMYAPLRVPPLWGIRQSLSLSGKARGDTNYHSKM